MDHDLNFVNSTALRLAMIAFIYKHFILIIQK